MNSIRPILKLSRISRLLAFLFTINVGSVFGQETSDSLAKSAEGLELFNAEGFVQLLVRLALNLGITTVLIRFIYYPITKRKDFMFTFMLVSLSIFFLCYILSSVSLDLAFALGLFAIFGIIRYRTDAIPIKEMTYLFIVIGLAVMNSLAAGVSMAEIGFANGLILLLTYGLEKVWLLRHESHKIVLYERIELIKSGNRDALKADLEERTGIIINRVEVGRIDFLRDTALVKIYFYEDAQEGHFEETTGGGE